MKRTTRKKKKAAEGESEAAAAASAKKRMEEAITTVGEVLSAAGWDVRRTDAPEGVAFDVEIAGKEAVKLAHAEVFRTSERFALLFIFRKKAPKPRRAEVAELVARMNYGMVTGGFEMDFDGGEVRYRFGIDFTGAPLHPLLVRNAVLSSFDALEMYQQAVVEVMEGRASPRAAITAAEAAAEAPE